MSNFKIYLILKLLSGLIKMYSRYQYKFFNIHIFIFNKYIDYIKKTY